MLTLCEPLSTPLLGRLMCRCFFDTAMPLSRSTPPALVSSRYFPFKPELLEESAAVLKRFGIKLILDVDDWWHIPKHNPAHQQYENSIAVMKNGVEVKRVGLRWLIERSLKLADEVWVTNAQLAKEARLFNKNVKIYPNAIDTTEPQWFKTIKEDTPNVRFGYIGGNTHIEDLKASTIDLTGYESYTIKGHGYADIINAQYILPEMSPNTYATLYDAIDVSLVPLQRSAFNACKSFLKMLEAGFTNTACIVSDVLPYSEIITKQNCISITHPSQWAKEIKAMTKQKAQDYAGALYESVQPYTMAKNTRGFNH